MLRGAHHFFGLGEWDIGSISLSPSIVIMKKITMRHNIFAQGSKFNSKLVILEFEGRIHVDNFLDWVNTMERVF